LRIFPSGPCGAFLTSMIGTGGSKSPAADVIITDNESFEK